MNVPEAEYQVPTPVAGLIAVVVGLSFVYGIVVMRSFFAPITFWLGVGAVALALFVTFLFYRLVVAVETIAEKL